MSSIFINPTITPAQQAANQVIQIAIQQYRSLQQSGLQGFNLIWKNPRATPEEIIGELGTDAETIFGLASLNIGTINTAAVMAGTTPPTMPEIPAHYELHFNSDGSAVAINTSDHS
jgi:hypothetical protein